MVDLGIEYPTETLNDVEEDAVGDFLLDIRQLHVLWVWDFQ